MIFHFLFTIVPLSLSLLTQIVSIQDFSLPNAVDGNVFSLSEVEDNEAVVVIFTSNYCPYAKLYDRRISSLFDTYRQQGVKFILINPNNPSQSPSDSPTEMAKKVKDLRWNVPYLVDDKQEAADLFNVQKTPEAFVMQNRGDDYQILYRGSIDDNPQVASDVSHHYLKDAIDAVLQGKPILNDSTHPTGCMIKN
ncbi:peroxiredoxin [Catalinimonas alkaloidigena]|uniref:thioredoxin family protein n=1 Tax=Catalinimonas alkaloidigena TaxID=1075417 RepID=UPI002405F85E|nr:thioredoxin family protein [Catalinimonas alkaloidigena]MDF9800654.1 peroxiredoxin [Catalinimonas alkaloidigena]